MSEDVKDLSAEDFLVKEIQNVFPDLDNTGLYIRESMKSNGVASAALIAIKAYAEQERMRTFEECRKQVDIGHCPEFIYDNWEDYRTKNPLV